MDSVTSRKSRSRRTKGQAADVGSSVNDPRALDVTQVGQTSADPILSLKVRIQRPVTDTQRSHSQGTQRYINLDVQFNCSTLSAQPTQPVLKKTT